MHIWFSFNLQMPKFGSECVKTHLVEIFLVKFLQRLYQHTIFQQKICFDFETPCPNFRIRVRVHVFRYQIVAKM